MTRRCATGVWTTPATIGWSQVTRPTTSTPPARATAWTSPTRYACGWCWIRCAIGQPSCTSTGSASTWRLDDDLLILANAWWEPVAFGLPDVGRPADWQVELGTYDPQRTAAVTAGDPVTVGLRSLTVLRPTRASPSAPLLVPP
jgi:hypothetical protein